MKNLIPILFIILCIFMTDNKILADGEQKPVVQIAILLDTSGSMDGLIEQAKSQLWKIVNEFALAKHEGVRPELQVALYEYGKASISTQEGYLRMILPLTTDLDKISQELFALTTNGGDEYCGRVIKAATDGLSWSRSNKDYKTIFIAGNEPFTQGDVNYADACKAAITKGIIVNTIHCGPYDQGVNGNWQDGAILADGKYLNIDQNSAVAHIEAPQDKEISRLGVEINKTYIAYGKYGKEGCDNQMAQDKNAASSAGESMVQRSNSKSSLLYCNTSWDLVDACKLDSINVAEVKEEDLPEEMKKMNVDERMAFVDGKSKEREQIQQQISTLNKERIKIVAEEMKKNAVEGKDTLDTAIIKAVREQCAKKDYKFE